MSKIKYNIDNAKKVASALIFAGATPVSLPFLMAQVAHETGDFDSNVYRNNNNMSGITYINKPSKQKNASRGTALPKSEWSSPDKPIYYAKFNTLTDWAKDYLRLVGSPVQKAKSIEEYAKMLKDRGYYTATLKEYTDSMKKHIAELTSLKLTNAPLDDTGILFASVALIAILFFTL